MNFTDYLPKNLPFLRPQNSPQEYFFALNIDFDHLTAAVWTLSSNRLQLVNIASSPLRESGDPKSEEVQQALIEAANYSLDGALADLTPEPTKLLFGVSDSWLEDENIKPEYLKVLKKMVHELGVEPLAYVSTVHAISHLLQKQQGVPLSAVLIQVGDPVVVAVVKGGKTLGYKVIRKEGKLGAVVETALLGLSDIEVLPSRILVYGTGGLGQAKDELSAYPWMNQLPFLHLPRVETLPEAVAIQAVCFAGASELNPNVSPEVALPLAQEEKAGQLNRHFPPEEEAAEVRGLDEAGFVEGDIHEQKKEPPGLEEESSDLVEQEEWLDRRQPAARMPSREDYPEGSVLSRLKKLTLLPLAVFKAGGFPKPQFAPLGMLSLLTSRFVIIPLLVLILSALAVLFLPKAQVTVFVDMKPLENSTQVIADPATTSVDVENNRIPGKLVETDVSGSGEGTATGKKQIGDPAKGKVVIYNATTKTVNLSSGTTLITDSGLKFTLDSAVQIASKSASAADPASRSDTVGATAANIGPDGNIAAGMDLAVAGYNKADVVAKVDTAFSGGISKDVTVVTADDQKRLLAQLSNNLRQKARDQLQAQLSGDTKILPESFSETITKKSFSKDVNDQASKFTLSLSARYRGTSYSDGDLRSIVAKLVQNKVADPARYTLDMSQAETQAEVIKVDKDGKLYFNATFKAKLMPKLDVEKLKRAIAGKTPGQAEQILKDLESDIIGAEVKISPSLPRPLQRLPFRTQNIQIEVAAK